jgi:hypothetical protein
VINPEDLSKILDTAQPGRRRLTSAFRLSLRCVEFAKVGGDSGHAVQPSPWQTSIVRGGVGARLSGGC